MIVYKYEEEKLDRKTIADRGAKFKKRQTNYF